MPQERHLALDWKRPLERDRGLRCALREAGGLDFRRGSIKLGSAVMKHAASIFRVQAFRLVQHYRDVHPERSGVRRIFLALIREKVRLPCECFSGEINIFFSLAS